MKRTEKISEKLPTNDLIFCKLFGEEYSKGYLIDFLESILKIKIGNVKIENQKRLTGDNQDDKYVVLDIVAETKDFIADIEIQVKDEGNMIDRSLFYWSKLYYDQLEKGKSIYEKVKKVIAINILQYEQFKDNDNIVEKIEIKRENNEVASEMFEMYIIQIPKIEKHKEQSKLADWIYFLIQNKKEVKRAMLTNKQIEEAQKKYDEIVLNKELNYAIFRRKIAMMDKASMEARAKKRGMEQGRQEGIKKGIKQGMKKGMQQGMKKGMQQGIQQGKQQGVIEGRAEGVAETQRKNVLNMHKEGLKVEDISKFLRMEKQEVEKIIKEENEKCRNCKNANCKKERN